MRTYIIYGILFLALLGLADSAYLAKSYFSGTPLVCAIIDGCNEVAGSPYSKLFGIPLSSYGILYYIAILFLGALLLTGKGKPLFLVLASGFGFLMSLYFTSLQIFVIEALCIYCLGSALFSTIIFIGSIVLYRSGRSTLPQIE